MPKSSPHTFLLEVGTEDLPARFVSSALRQWHTLIPQTLKEQGLEGEVKVWATPRRLAVLIEGLPPQQPDQAIEIKGPAASVAFREGEPTPALLGFLRSRQGRLEEIEIRPTEKGEVVYLKQVRPGQPTPQRLTELAPQWIAALEGARFMRWGDGDLRFSRPIRWLVLLWEDQVLPLVLESHSVRIASDRTTYGHRVLSQGAIVLKHAQDYEAALETAGVLVDPEVRQQRIREQIAALAAEAGGWVDLEVPLLEEVTHLVEWPTAVLGSFEARFLALPLEVITTVLVSHQRYFPVYTDATRQALLPVFITISNGDPAATPLIRAGNERVIRARLADAEFFYKADTAQPLEHYRDKLATVTFQDELGSMADKVERLTVLARQIATALNCAAADVAAIERTACLCKADLVTQMVGEFPELQGYMGQVYATVSGEAPAVATGIFEHYLPRFAGDRPPQSLTGQVVGLADRLDTLVCLFGIGLCPTGSSDPFALRRAANAVITILWQGEHHLDFLALLQESAQAFCRQFAAKLSAADLEQQLRQFFSQRLRTLLQEELGIEYDLVNAVIPEDQPGLQTRALRDVVDARDRAQFLQKLRQSGELMTIYPTVNRATRLARQGTLGTDCLNIRAVKAKHLAAPIEKEFYAALKDILPTVQQAQVQRAYGEIVRALASLAPIVSRFFDGEESVLVMAEDATVRANRLALLGLLRNCAAIIGDFGAIVQIESVASSS
ncbi:glycine--tRNA ligase subunit beta [Thermosynechococcus sp. HY213]|uniref:glycine--tRNA ligase subunit beta n=1 Tax=Thermosynechococcus sp. HY213 TaxID=3074104 RepID=UPI0028609F86|nr:glycine--tRNA ligase subunit beta [Thermosynechococcus sp. HY213]MDR7922529.1 glycine--tRNA ligase subunit beta [Thermosynechococcus sp. HY213]